jgi:hypothetical protein
MPFQRLRVKRQPAVAQAQGGLRCCSNARAIRPSTSSLLVPGLPRGSMDGLPGLHSGVVAGFGNWIWQVVQRYHFFERIEFRGFECG